MSVSRRNDMYTETQASRVPGRVVFLYFLCCTRQGVRQMYSWMTLKKQNLKKKNVFFTFYFAYTCVCVIRSTEHRTGKIIRKIIEKKKRQANLKYTLKNSRTDRNNNMFKGVKKKKNHIIYTRNV